MQKREEQKVGYYLYSPRIQIAFYTKPYTHQKMCANQMNNRTDCVHSKLRWVVVFVVVVFDCCFISATCILSVFKCKKEKPPKKKLWTKYKRNRQLLNTIEIESQTRFDVRLEHFCIHKTHTPYYKCVNVICGSLCQLLVFVCDKSRLSVSVQHVCNCIGFCCIILFSSFILSPLVNSVCLCMSGKSADMNFVCVYL